MVIPASERLSIIAEMLQLAKGENAVLPFGPRFFNVFLFEFLEGI